MPNSYTAVPNVIPGAVTIGGNLTVKGDVLTIGSGTPKVRLWSNAGSGVNLYANLATDFATRDDASKPAIGWGGNFTANPLFLQRINAAGTSRIEALVTTIFSDYALHIHSGDTSEDTIYTVPVRGNTLGSNGGLRIQLAVSPTVQGGTAGTLRVKFGGTTLINLGVIAANNDLVWLTLVNRNAPNAQTGLWYSLIGTSVVGTNSVAAAIDTTVDQSLVITMQSGANTDSQNFTTFDVQQINSFGPVTG